MNSTKDIAKIREEEHKKAWNNVKDKISEGQVVSRYCQKYQAFWRIYRN